MSPDELERIAVVENDIKHISKEISELRRLFESMTIESKKNFSELTYRYERLLIPVIALSVLVSLFFGSLPKYIGGFIK